MEREKFIKQLCRSKTLTEKSMEAYWFLLLVQKTSNLIFWVQKTSNLVIFFIHETFVEHRDV